MSTKWIKDWINNIPTVDDKPFKQEIQISKNEKVWFKYPNGIIQKVYLYKTFTANGEKCYRGKMGKKYFVLKEKDYGKYWSKNKEDLQ